MIHKVHNHLFQLRGLHLPMSHHHSSVGHMLTNERLYVAQRGDAMRHDIYLSISTQFKVDGIGNDLMSEGVNLRLNGMSAGWRCIDHAQIACAHERKLERYGESVWADMVRGVDIHL